LTPAELSQTKSKAGLYNPLLEEKANGDLSEPSSRFPISKPLQILHLLVRNGSKKTVYSVSIGQADLARELGITRQGLSLHLRKLREAGLVRVGRGFVDVTEEGSRAVGYRRDPVIVTAKILPQKRSEAIQKIDQLPTMENFRVTGDADVVLIVEQDKLDHVLEMLSCIDGVVETKSLVSISSR
jgi:DNA-binding Lrp family transcriptional regulator